MNHDALDKLRSLVQKWRTNEVIGDRSKQTFAQCADELESALALLSQSEQPVAMPAALKVWWDADKGLQVESISPEQFYVASPNPGVKEEKK